MNGITLKTVTEINFNDRAEISDLDMAKVTENYGICFMWDFRYKSSKFYWWDNKKFRNIWSHEAMEPIPKSMKLPANCDVIFTNQFYYFPMPMTREAFL